MVFRKDKKKKNKLSIIIIGLFLISIMVASVINLSVSNNSNTDPSQGFETKEYNGREFYLSGTGWVTTYGGSQILLSYAPWEANLTNINLNSLVSLNKIYLTYSPNDSVQAAAQELLRYVTFNKIVQACPLDIEGCKDLPLKTCDDAANGTGIIYFKEDNETFIDLSNDCLFIQGSGSDLIKAVDSIVWSHLGI